MCIDTGFWAQIPEAKAIFTRALESLPKRGDLRTRHIFQRMHSDAASGFAAGQADGSRTMARTILVSPGDLAALRLWVSFVSYWLAYCTSVLFFPFSCFFFFASAVLLLPAT